MPSTDTAIIGAGPYGLSLAAYLDAAGVPHHILGQPMLSWRNFMPPGMLMRSEAFASNLYAPRRGYTLEAYCGLRHIEYRPVAMHLPLELFVDYGLWFQSQLVGHVRTTDVVDMQRADGWFHLSLSDGSTLDARRVVIALGLKGFAQMPPVLQGLPKPYVLHSGKFGGFEWARQKDIVIVGGGQSALGLAALMHEGGAHVRVLVRDADVTWHDEPDLSRSVITKLCAPVGGLGAGWKTYLMSEFPFLFRMLDPQHRRRLLRTSYGPSGAWWLRDRVVGKIDVCFGSEICSATVDNGRIGLHVTSGTETKYIEAHHVIAATGFKTDIRRHAFLSQEILDSLSLSDGAPELTGNFETPVRGLYIIGPASAHSYGPAMRFVYGAKFAVPWVTLHIRHRVRAENRRASRSRLPLPDDAPVN